MRDGTERPLTLTKAWDAQDKAEDELRETRRELKRERLQAKHTKETFEQLGATLRLATVALDEAIALQKPSSALP